MKDFDRFSHAGVKNELLRLRNALSARSPGVQFGSSGDGEITIKGSNATAYARKYKRETGWRLAVHRGGGGNVSYPETTNDVIRELRQILAADVSIDGLAWTERGAHSTQPNEEPGSRGLIQRSSVQASPTATDLQAIVSFWSKQHCAGRKWLHPDDEHVLRREPHSFNLDFPAGQYVGDILRAPVVILGANGGYSSRTPNEFRSQDCVQEFLARQKDPSSADWRSTLPPYYYDETNYGQWLADGRAALVNACAYRSPKISKESDNKKIIKKLPSVGFTRSWLLDVLIPLAQSEQRLVVVKRPGLWSLPDLQGTVGIVFDRTPISARITGGAMRAVQHFLAANPQSAK